MEIFKITGLTAAGIMLAACQSDSYKINGECDLLSNGDTIFITNDFSSGKPFAHGIIKDGKFTAGRYSREDCAQVMDTVITDIAKRIIFFTEL